MRDWTIASLHDFQEGVRVRRATLEFNSNGGEEDNLDGSASFLKSARARLS